MIRDYIILTHPRTASTNFGKSLAQHPDVQFAGELFNAGRNYEEYLIKKYNIKTWQKSGLSAVAYYKQIKTKMQEKPVFGFKLFRNDLPENELRALIQTADKIIILYRNNMYAAAISYQLAKLTGIWEAGQSGEIPSSLHLDIRQVEEFVNYHIRSIAIYDEICLKAKKGTIRINYEKLVSSPKETFKGIFRHLGVKEIEVGLLGRKLN